MKNRITGFLLAAALFFPAAVLADEIKITVKGMVCSFCAQGIKKTFSKNEKVAETKVDLDKKLVEVKTKQGVTISDDDLKEVINDAGYDVLSIERKDA